MSDVVNSKFPPAARWAGGAGKGIILMYHRVAEIPSDPWSLCVTPRHFAQHLEVLRRFTHPQHIRTLSQSLQDGCIPDLSVAVTFDDGYADNLDNARPLLEHYDIPATVFLTTGYIGLGREFWWDELERLLLQPGSLPPVLRLDINGMMYQWELGDAAYYPEARWRRERSWRPFADSPSSRHSLYTSLWQLLRPLPESERQTVLNNLLVWADAEPNSRQTHRTLSLQAAVALGRGDLIEIGSHTVTHPLLSTLSSVLQQEEIQRSKARLEEIIGRPITSFAYPYGDYTAETVGVVRQAGFNCACSTNAGIAQRDSDRFQLPRVPVEDWDGEEFNRRFCAWLA